MLKVALLASLLVLPCDAYRPRLAPLSLHTRPRPAFSTSIRRCHACAIPDNLDSLVSDSQEAIEFVAPKVLSHSASPKVEDEGMTNPLVRRFPIFGWAPKLNSSSALGDVISGVTVATMLIPQGMSYATIAGLHPIVGLYCYVPLIVYAAMGTSRYVSVGPVALVSTTLFGMVASQASAAAKLALASTLMFWGGVLSTVLGLLGLGFVLEVMLTSHSATHPFPCFPLAALLAAHCLLAAYARQSPDDRCPLHAVLQF